MNTIDTDRLGVIQQDPNAYDDGILRIEHDSFLVTFNGQVLFLPPKEFLILSGLSRNMGQMVKSKMLWRYAWRQDAPFSSRTLRVHICTLRRKIKPMGLNIRHVASVGYCLFWHRQQFRPGS